LVRQELAALFADPVALITRCAPDMPPAMMGPALRRCQDLTATPGSLVRPVIRDILRRIVVHPAGLRFVLDPAGLARLLGIAPSPHRPNEVLHEAAVRLTRTGRAVRLVQEDGRAATGALPDPAVVRLLATARSWWRELSGGGIDIAALSRREGVTPSWMTRVVRLAFLAPEVVEAILAGRTRAGIDAKALLATGAVPAGWARQRAILLTMA
jgi:site-specific DNA recombinase